MQVTSIVDSKQQNYIFECPHCNGTIIIVPTDFNCRIFRHGIYKNSGQQLNPHAIKEVCDAATDNGEIYGCGKPFRINRTGNGTEEIVVCDYI